MADKRSLCNVPLMEEIIEIHSPRFVQKFIKKPELNVRVWVREIRLQLLFSEKVKLDLCNSDCWNTLTSGKTGKYLFTERGLWSLNPISYTEVTLGMDFLLDR